jgi:hypothetical protein
MIQDLCHSRPSGRAIMMLTEVHAWFGGYIVANCLTSLYCQSLGTPSTGAVCWFSDLCPTSPGPSRVIDNAQRCVAALWREDIKVVIQLRGHLGPHCSKSCLSLERAWTLEDSVAYFAPRCMSSGVLHQSSVAT